MEVPWKPAASISTPPLKNAEIPHDAAVAQRYGQEWEWLCVDSVEMKARY
jgi:hypothetical protein